MKTDKTYLVVVGAMLLGILIITLISIHKMEPHDCINHMEIKNGTE